MLFKNGERIDLSVKNSDNPDVKDFQEKKQWVKDNIGFPVVFKIKPTHLSKQEREDGKIEFYMPTWRLPNVCIVDTEDGQEEWRWSPVNPRVNKNGETEFPREYKRSTYDKKVFALGEKDMDRIYFLMFKNPTFLRSYFDLDDDKVKATGNVKEKMKEAKIMKLFYDENSPLQKDEKRLREIARAWNIPDVQKLTKDQLLERLETTVREQDTKGIKSIKDFEEACQLGDYYTEVAAMVQKAEDLGVIKADENVSAWYYVNADKSYGEKICFITKGKWDYRYEILKDYIFAEKDHIGRIKSMVQGTNVPRGMQLNFDDLENEDYEKVMAYCNLNGIPLTGRGRNKATVLAEVRKFANR